jgi:hypothetical protein
VSESAGGSVRLPCRQGEETVGATRGRCLCVPCPESRVTTGAIRRRKALKESNLPAKVRNFGRSRPQHTEMARYFDYEELIHGIVLKGARKPFWGRSGATCTVVGAEPMVCLSLGRDLRGPQRAAEEGDLAGVHPAGKSKQTNKGQAEVACHLRVLWHGQSATGQYDSGVAGGLRTGSRSIRGDE